MVITATGTTGRSVKASKKHPNMEKDGNLNKNTKKLEKNRFITIFPAENYNDTKHS